MISLLVLASLCLVQDATSEKEQERLVRCFFAIDRADRGQIEEGRRILRDLAGVPFPDKRGRKRWEKVFADALEERHGIRPIEEQEGEHADPMVGRSGRYFLGGTLKRPKGLFVGLHGGGEGSGDGRAAWSNWSAACEEAGWLGIFPEVLEKTERGWTDAGTEEWVLDLIERTVASFGLDAGRVVIGGHSMGGYGAWVIGAHHADRFSAAIASAGAPTPIYQGGRIVSIEKGVVPNLSALPLLVFQSTDDEQVPPDANQAAVAEVAKAKERYGGFANFHYWEVSDRGHGFPDGGPGKLLERVVEFERDPLPLQVVWQPSLTWKRQFYWLSWDEPKLGATVVARRTENTIDVDLRRTEGAGLAVLVNEKMLDLSQPVIVRVNGHKAFEGLVEPSFTTWVKTSALGDPGRAFVAEIPLTKQ